VWRSSVALLSNIYARSLTAVNSSRTDLSWLPQNLPSTVYARYHYCTTFVRIIQTELLLTYAYVYEVVFNMLP
jgi:hypothetical protein